MKLILTNLFLMALLFPALGQMTGGGATGGAPAAGKSSSGKGHKWSTLNFGFANPIGKFRQNDLTKPFYEAVGAKPGFYLAFDGNSYFKGTVDNPVKIGLSYTIGISVNGVNWEKWVPGTTEFESHPFVTADFKLGVIGTYDLNDDMSVDGFFRMGPLLGVAGGASWYNGNDSYNFSTEGPAIGFGAGFGGNFRFHSVMVTLQLNPAKLKYLYYMDSYNGSSTSGEVDYKVPVSTARIGLGFVFGRNR